MDGWMVSCIDILVFPWLRRWETFSSTFPDARLSETNPHIPLTLQALWLFPHTGWLQAGRQLQLLPWVQWGGDPSRRNCKGWEIYWCQGKAHLQVLLGRAMQQRIGGPEDWGGFMRENNGKHGWTCRLHQDHLPQKDAERCVRSSVKRCSLQVGPHCLSRVLDIRVFPCEGSSCTFSHDGEEEKTDEAPTAAGDDVASDPESGQGW